MDASEIALGAVLEQYHEQEYRPIAFFSRKLSEAQRKYSAYDRELLAVYQAVKYFRHFLEGRNFVIFVDHLPLTFAFHQKLDKASPRQARHLDYIGKFSTDIRYIKGKENVVADALSRIQAVDSITFPTSFDYDDFRKHQETDPQLQQILTNPASSSLDIKLTSQAD